MAKEADKALILPAEKIFVGEGIHAHLNENPQIPIGSLKVPGRANLIGEHMDYNGGHSVPFAIDLSLDFDLSIRKHPGKPSRVFIGPIADGSNRWCQLIPDTSPVPDPSHQTGDLKTLFDHTKSFSKADRRAGIPYFQGAWNLSAVSSPDCALKPQPICIPEGYDVIVHIKGNLPTGSGLSSSAALSIGLLIVFRHARECLALDKMQNARTEFFPEFPQDLMTSAGRFGLARLAQLIEHNYAGTPCGLMDQLAIVMTPETRQTYLKISFPVSKTLTSGGDVNTTLPQLVTFDAAPLFDRYDTIIFHSGKEHDLADGQYAQRREQCSAALSALNKYWNTQAISLGAFFQSALAEKKNAICHDISRIDEILCRTEWSDTVLRNRARFVGEEIIRVTDACRALETGDALRLAELLAQAQNGLEKHYEVSCPEVNCAVSLFQTLAGDLRSDRHSVDREPGLIGPRMMGGGFGGSLVLLVHQNHKQTFFERAQAVLERYHQQTGCAPRLLKTHKAAGITWQASKRLR